MILKMKIADNETDKKRFLLLSGSSNIYSVTLLSYPSFIAYTQKLVNTCLQFRLDCLDLKSQPEDNHEDIFWTLFRSPYVNVMTL